MMEFIDYSKVFCLKALCAGKETSLLKIVSDAFNAEEYDYIIFKLVLNVCGKRTGVDFDFLIGDFSLSIGGGDMKLYSFYGGTKKIYPYTSDFCPQAYACLISKEIVNEFKDNLKLKLLT